MFKQTLLWLSRILGAGLVFSVGLIVSRLLAYTAGFNLPRMPSQAPESIAGFYLITGSIILALGLVLLAKGIDTSPLVRWFVLTMFLFLGFAVSTTIETSIFSSTTGTLLMVPILLLPCLLLAGVLALSMPPPAIQDQANDGRIKQFFHTQSWTGWSWRMGVAIVSFPLIYFVFGLLVSPIVSDYYAGGVSGLALPEPTVIVQVQFLRGIIHLVSALPLIILWRGDQQLLIKALALAFFAFVFAYDIVLANQIPLVLVLVHGVEVLAGSFVYTWTLVSLLRPGKLQAIQSSAV